MNPKKIDKTEEKAIARALCESAYPLSKKDLPRAAQIMAAAFDKDPSIRHLLGGEREGRHDRRYFLTLLKAIYGRCVMLSRETPADSLLILFPPRKTSVPTLRFLLAGGLALPLFFGGGMFPRSMAYEENCKRVRAKTAARNAWYCMCFVVSPERQGKGVGSSLLSPVLGVLDRYRVPLYLETHRAENVSLYEHFGFALTDVGRIPRTGITQYAMQRSPQGTEKGTSASRP